MLNKFLSTTDSWGILLIRLALVITIFPHGAQKLLGWFGGFGFEGTMGYFTETMGFSWIVAFLIILGESLGAMALLLGLGSRFMAFGIGVIMIGAMTQHQANGFFMNWFGNQAGEGLEYFILALGMSLAVIVSGGGKWSLDSLLARRVSS